MYLLIIFRDLKKLLLKCLFLSLFLLLPLINYSQNGTILNFDRITSENYKIEKGLSQNSAYCITQDHKGYIWIGTWDGLNRYDGYEFLTFRPSITENSSQLSNQTVYALLVDRNGILWIGTESGLNSYDYKTQKFKHYTKNKKNPFSISSDTVLCIVEQDEKTLWIGTSNGLNRFDKTTEHFYHFRLNPNDANSPSNNTINCILLDEKNNLWFGTNEGLNYYDRKNRIFSHWYEKSETKNSISNDVVKDIVIDNSGRLWVATDSGLNVINISNGRVIKKYFHSEQDENSISHNSVTSILLDRDNNLWIGTYGGGLNKYNPDNDNFFSYKNDIYNNRSISNDYINKIYQDKSGIIWVATAWKGVSKIDKFSNRFQHFQHLTNDNNSLNDNNVWSIYQDNKGRLWIATDKGVNIYDRNSKKFSFITVQKNTKNTLPTNMIRQVFQDSEGLYWIGTFNGGISIYNEKTKTFTNFRYDKKNPFSLSSDFVNYIFEDSKKNIWIATDNGLNLYQPQTKRFKRYQKDENNPASLSDNSIYYIYEDQQGFLWLCTLGGLNRFDPKTEKFFAFRKTENNKPLLSSDKIFSLYEDKDGVFWIATCGGGLNRFDRKTGEVKYYFEENGLANNVVYNIFEDNTNNLWISTNYGLSRFNKKTETFVNYDVKDGIQSNEFNLNAAFHNKQTGEMFFGGMNGFNAFFPEKILKNEFIPSIVITSFKKFDKKQPIEINDGDTLFLSYEDNFFSFEFASMDYSNPYKNKYAYILENFDKSWNYCDAYRRFAGYTKVPPGVYIFKVKGTNSDGLWNDKGISFTIIIATPWWKTWWFRIILVFVVSSIAWYMIYMKMRNIRIRHEDEKKILEIEKQMFNLEQTALRLQMNPHFIFNSLNSIQSFVIANDTDKAIHYLAKFSNLMRFILAHSQKSFVNFSDEIKAMEIYLDIERLRFNNKFEYQINISPEIDEEFIEIPPMILQPYIENAIIHGILNKEGPGCIKIDIKRKDEKYLICIIEDDGIGRQRAAKIKAESGLTHKSRGMLITQKRLEILNKSSDAQANVNIIDLKNEKGEPAGTRVEVLVIYKEID